MPLLCSSLLPLVAGAVASDKHYAIMDNDWYTAGFVPYLIALDGDVDVLALASGECTKHKLNTVTDSLIQTLPIPGSPKLRCTPLRLWKLGT